MHEIERKIEEGKGGLTHTKKSVQHMCVCVFVCVCVCARARTCACWCSRAVALFLSSFSLLNARALSPCHNHTRRFGCYQNACSRSYTQPDSLCMRSSVFVMHASVCCGQTCCSCEHTQAHEHDHHHSHQQESKHEHNFVRADVNRDRKLDFAEFCAMNCVKGRSEHQLKKIFRRLDVNGDKLIDKKEFRKYEDDIFKAADENNNGFLCFQEFSSLICNRGRSEQELKQIFKLLDENHDGSIDRKEFKNLDLKTTEGRGLGL
jgi:Ca2+-binding EF-hand superfamily protein